MEPQGSIDFRFFAFGAILVIAGVFLIYGQWSKEL